MVEKIEMFLSTENKNRKAMGENGRAYVSENFSREKVISAYLQTIEKLLTKSAAKQPVKEYKMVMED